MIKLKRILKEIMTNAPPPAIIQSHPQTEPVKILNEKDIQTARLLAATIWGEGRSEGETGMHAVLNVVMNRAGNDLSKVSEIVLKPKQFSFWNGISNPNEYANNLSKEHAEEPKKFKKLPDSQSYDKAVELVDKVIANKLKDITHGAQYYFTPDQASPEWKKGMVKTVTIGHHEFYKKKG